MLLNVTPNNNNNLLPPLHASPFCILFCFVGGAGMAEAGGGGSGVLLAS